jgi:hypothetical protein
MLQPTPLKEISSRDYDLKDEVGEGTYVALIQGNPDNSH